MSIIGMDIGNFATKSSKGVIFESKVGTFGSLLGGDATLTTSRGTVTIGEGELDTEYRKVKKESYIDLFTSLLALSTDDITNYVVVGLPLSQFKEDKDELIQLIMSNAQQDIVINQVEKKLIIEDVSVWPEGLVQPYEGFEGLMIDIGGGTTDAAMVTIRNGRSKIEKPISFPFGTIKMYSDFIKRINSQYGLDLTNNDAERILRNGLKIQGQQQDITFAMDAFKDKVDSIIKELQVEYSLKTLDVSIQGGGALLLEGPLRKRIPNLEVIENPVFANANYFAELGEEMF